MLVGNPAEWTIRATDPRTLTQRGHSAYMKIAEGCNRQCSFCAIPGIRGKQRSRTVEDVVTEATQLVSNAAWSSSTSSARTPSPTAATSTQKATLAQLIEALAEVPGLSWIRVHYLYPEALTEPLVELFAKHPKVLPYIDMPLQHASRRHAHAHAPRPRRRAPLPRGGHAARRTSPTWSFRTTFIVGHPGETDEDFAELKKFVQYSEFDHVGVFMLLARRGHPRGHHDRPGARLRSSRRATKSSWALQRPISRDKLEGARGHRARGARGRRERRERVPARGPLVGSGARGGRQDLPGQRRGASPARSGGRWCATRGTTTWWRTCWTVTGTGPRRPAWSARSAARRAAGRRRSSSG
jgi:ribosomal protein S12 methylthiotransferase